MSSGTALLVIDAQVSMFAAGSSVLDGEGILKTLAWLISRARAAGVLVVYVQNNGRKGDPDQLGTAGWQIHPSLATQAGDLVIQKSAPDAFHLTPLQKELTKREIRRVIIAGMQSDLSIDATCRRAASVGYEVTLVADGHGTYDAESVPADEIIARQNTAMSTTAKVVEASKVDFLQGSKQRRTFA